MTGGGRLFKYDNTLIGFFGFGRDPAFIQGAENDVPPNAIYSSRTGVAACFTESGVRLRDAQLAGQADTTLLPAAVDVILETGQASVSMLQRRLKLGYARAARIMDEMEERGIVGPFEGSKPRQLLITREQWQAIKDGAPISSEPVEEEIP